PIKIVSVAERRYCAGDKADIPKYRSCGEFENGEPSAQSCHVDVSDRLLCGGARRGSESRGWQKPFPDIRGHPQRLSQKPARPFEDGPGGIAVRFPAPALYDQPGHGERAVLLLGVQWRERHALRCQPEGWQGWREGIEIRSEARGKGGHKV